MSETEATSTAAEVQQTTAEQTSAQTQAPSEATEESPPSSPNVAETQSLKRKEPAASSEKNVGVPVVNRTGHTQLQQDSDDEEEIEENPKPAESGQLRGAARRKAQLLFSTPPNYGITYILFLVFISISLMAGFTVTFWALLYTRVNWLFWLMSSAMNFWVIAFVLLRLPIRYQVWNDKFVVATLESYIFPFRLFSINYKLRLTRIKEVQEIENTFCIGTPEAWACLLPNTFTNSFLPLEGKFVRLMVDEDLIWRNFIITPRYHKQFLAQLTRAIKDSKDLYGEAEDDDSEDDFYSEDEASDGEQSDDEKEPRKVRAEGDESFHVRSKPAEQNNSDETALHFR